MRGTNIFASIGKALFESNAERIRWRSNMWAIPGSRWAKKPLDIRFNTDMRVLVKKVCTLCPSPPASDFYLSEDSKKYYVPATECRKCQYHRGANRTFNFPRCTFKKTGNLIDAQIGAATQFNELLTKAT